MTDFQALAERIRVRSSELKNCGTGAGGFEPGNSCGRGGDDSSGSRVGSVQSETTPHGTYEARPSGNNGDGGPTYAVTFTPKGGEAQTVATVKGYDEEDAASNAGRAIRDHQARLPDPDKYDLVTAAELKTGDFIRTTTNERQYGYQNAKVVEVKPKSLIVEVNSMMGGSYVPTQVKVSRGEVELAWRGKASGKSWAADAFDAAIKNCGTGGAEGFSPGNTCAKGGGAAAAQDEGGRATATWKKKGDSYESTFEGRPAALTKERGRWQLTFDGTSVTLPKKASFDHAEGVVQQMMKTPGLPGRKSWAAEAFDAALVKNCGNGPGGFTEGNTCARGGGGAGEEDGGTTGAGPAPSRETASRYAELHDNMALNHKGELSGDSVDDRHLDAAIADHKEAARNFRLADDAFKKGREELGQTYLSKAHRFHERGMNRSKKLGLTGRLNDKGGSTIL